MGLISEESNMAFSMIIPLLAYVYIAYYAFLGSKYSEDDSEEREMGLPIREVDTI